MVFTYSNAISTNQALNSQNLQNSLSSDAWDAARDSAAFHAATAALATKAAEEKSDENPFYDACKSEGEPCELIPLPKSVMEIEGTRTEYYLGREYTINPAESRYYVFEDISDPNGFTAIQPNPGIDYMYSGFQKLSEKDWEERTPDTITFEGVRYAPNSFNNLPIFRETVHILLIQGDSVRATALYEDEGEDSTSTVDAAFFPVESSSGAFTGVELLKFNYFNNYEGTGQNVRIIELLRPADL